jgi:hypothetical protein
MALVVSVAIASSSVAPAEVPDDLVRSACSLPREWLLRIHNGTRTDWSGDLQLVTNEPDFVSGGLSHAGPWDYVQQVPMFWYGPGLIDGVGRVDRSVTSTDIAPTQAAMLGFERFRAPDGSALREVVGAGSTPGTSLRLLVTMVWDGGGSNVLHESRGDWPFLKSLIPHGVWYPRASIDASPSNTPPTHATIGTGALPFRHGALDVSIRVNGRVQKPNENGPAFLLRPTLADLYDRAMDNAPVVGALATLSAHLLMLGHGSMWGGGDRDIAVTREHLNAATSGAEGDVWNLSPAMAPFYRMPPYLNALPGIERDVEVVDRADGRADGLWLSNSIERLANGFDTPARSLYQTRVLEELVRREGFGRDRVTDLLFVNYKGIDNVGHSFSVNSAELRDTVRFQDRELRDFVRYLDREVGGGRWAMVVTADHGSQYSPDVTGAFAVDVDKVWAAIDKRFGASDDQPAVQKMRPTQIWLDRTVLAQTGATVEDVARFVGSLTKTQTVKPNDTVSLHEQNDPAFASVFPTSILSELPCLRDPISP